MATRPKPSAKNETGDYAAFTDFQPHAEMLEGPEAGTRFMSALKTILAVPKSSVPNPFSKPKAPPVKRKTRKS